MRASKKGYSEKDMAFYKARMGPEWAIREIKTYLDRGIYTQPTLDCALVLANVSLDKQIPKKFDWVDKFHFKCPTCNAIYSLGDSFLYCKNCGQSKDQ